MDSILVTVRKQLGVPSDYDGFDPEIISGVNSAILTLNQLGIGPEAGFWIAGIEEEWDSILESATDIEAVKHYIFLHARQSFDPPSTAHAIAALERQIEKLEWRLQAQVEEPVAEEE